MLIQSSKAWPLAGVRGGSCCCCFSKSSASPLTGDKAPRPAHSYTLQADCPFIPFVCTGRFTPLMKDPVPACPAGLTGPPSLLHLIWAADRHARTHNKRKHWPGYILVVGLPLTRRESPARPDTQACLPYPRTQPRAKAPTRPCHSCAPASTAPSC